VDFLSSAQTAHARDSSVQFSMFQLTVEQDFKVCSSFKLLPLNVNVKYYLGTVITCAFSIWQFNNYVYSAPWRLPKMLPVFQACSHTVAHTRGFRHFVCVQTTF